MAGFARWMLMLLATFAVAACASVPVPSAAQSASASVDPDAEYRLSAGDKVRVIVFGEETLTGEYVITSGGNLTFPLIGNLPATDKTVEQLQAAVSTALADGYVNNPRVSIQVVSFRPFYILGEVNRPGEYPVSTGLTLEQAVASAGGFTYRANTKRAFLKRASETQERPIEVRGASPVIVRAGDTIRILERHF